MADGRRKPDFKQLIQELVGRPQAEAETGPPKPYVDKLLVYPPQARLAMRRGRRFRRYLHQTGYLARIVKIFVALYEMEEPPENPGEYIIDHIRRRKVLPLKEKILVLEAQRETLIRYVEGLEDENLSLRARLWKWDPKYGREEQLAEEAEEEEEEEAQAKSSFITIKKPPAEFAGEGDENGGDGEREGLISESEPTQ